jgi:hypothetical protein
MEGRGDEHHLHAPDRPRGVVAPGRRVARRPDGEVGAAGGERIPGAREHFVQQAKARSALLTVELRREPEDLVQAHQRVHGDAQLRLPALRDLLHAAFDVGRGAQQLAPLHEQLTPRVGEHRPVPAAVEERDAQALFQLPYGVSDC